MKLSSVLAAALAAASIPVAALAYDRGFSDTSLHQRVLQGLRSGALSAREGAMLERELDQLARAEANALRDGRLKPGEARRLERERDRAQWSIERQMHDREFGDPRSSESRRMQAYVEQRIRAERHTTRDEDWRWARR